MSWRAYVRPQDFVWLLLFSALAVFSPQRDALSLSVLAALGIVQVLEPRLAPVPSVLLKLLLCYLLIGFSGGVESSFYLTLLLPVISAATSFSWIGTLLVTAAACAEYASFLLFLDQGQYIPDDQLRELIVRLLLFPAAGFLTNQLAEGRRTETLKLQVTAAELANANRNLAEAEAQIRRAERLAALGQLTAGLAHELRNPLATMKTSAEMLQRSVAQENDVSREMAGFIAEEVDRTSSLVTRFLEFARPHSLRLEKADLHQMLDRAIVRFERERVQPGASIFKNYSPDVPPLQFDAELIDRVILNLLSNAVQASPETGVVTVKTRLIGSRDTRTAEIAIIDRGSGIDPKNMESIFNPFFTTKPAGTGLGLAICSKIVHEHGGEITVESVLGEGSVFRVHLPVRE